MADRLQDWAESAVARQQALPTVVGPDRSAASTRTLFLPMLTMRNNHPYTVPTVDYTFTYTLCPWGAYTDRMELDRVLNDNDTQREYWVTRATQETTPGVALCTGSDAAEVRRVTTAMDFGLDGGSLRDHQPTTTNGSTTASVSFGLSTSNSGNSSSIGGSLGAGWSFPIPDVAIIDNSLTSANLADWDFLYAYKRPPALHTMVTQPGAFSQVPEQPFGAPRVWRVYSVGWIQWRGSPALPVESEMIDSRTIDAWAILQNTP